MATVSWQAEPSITSKALWSWSYITCYFPAIGDPGIHEFEVPSASHVLLYRTRFGRLAGFLESCDPAGPSRGELIVQVSGRHRRRGIATALLAEAMRRWPGRIDLQKQRYTEAGAAWINAVMRDSRS